MYLLYSILVRTKNIKPSNIMKLSVSELKIKVYIELVCSIKKI